MKILNKSTIIIAAVAVLIGLVVGWLIKPTSDSTSHSIDDHIGQNTHEEWTCSMHPSVRQNEPGKCPSCGFVNKEGSKFCEECGTKL